MDSSSDPTQNARLIFRSNRRWYGDQRLGSIAVWVDGTKLGRLAPSGTLEERMTPGSHAVRIGQWWYRSRTVAIDIQPNQSLVVDVVDPRSNNLVKQMALFIFAPRRSLVFKVTDSDSVK